MGGPTEKRIATWRAHAKAGAHSVATLADVEGMLAEIDRLSALVPSMMLIACEAGLAAGLQHAAEVTKVDIELAGDVQERLVSAALGAIAPVEGVQVKT